MKRKSLLPLLLALLSIQGCAGVRNSYQSLLEPNSPHPRITLKVGEKREVLAIGTGFPGWWGYYPGIASHDPMVADITCEDGRSLIPFREPGIIFGGERCYVETRKAGMAWLLTGNQLALRHMMEETDFSKMTGDGGVPSCGPAKWIKLQVKE